MKKILVSKRDSSIKVEKHFLEKDGDFYFMDGPDMQFLKGKDWRTEYNFKDYADEVL